MDREPVRTAAPRRRRRWVGVLGAVLVALVIAGVGVVLLATPLTAVRTITVHGEVHTPTSQLLAAAEPQRGLPLLRVRTGALTRAELALPWVRSVEITRSWPHTLVITVKEATAVAAVPAHQSGENSSGEGSSGHAPTGPFDIIDAAGDRIVTMEQPPTGVPVVAVTGTHPNARGGSSSRAAAAAGTVAAALPASLRTEVTTISAGSPDDVQLALSDGSRVVWGSSEHNALKAQVLRDLQKIGHDIHTYDVSAPDAPATS